MSMTVPGHPGLAPALRLILLSSAALLITDCTEIIVENASEVNVLVQRMQDIDNALAELAREGASCTVRASDFSTVYAVFSRDWDTNGWVVDCSGESSDDSP